MSFNRILALDVGTKRIGIALTDALAMTAQPLKTIQRTPEQESLKEIQNICAENNVDTIVVGLPKNMDGTLGSQAQDCQEYAQKITELSSAKIVFEDERLTSRQAERLLAEQNKKYTKNKGLVDVAAAALILQQYLDRRRLQND